MVIDIEKMLASKGALINREIAEVFPKRGILNLHDAVWHALPGGKRIRPILAIITCEALGGDSKQIIPFAAACEVLHNWLLVHDDIEDGDRVRRNKPAVWVKYGISHGINVGDYMAQKVYELVLRSKRYGVADDVVCRLMDIMVETSVKTAEGQALDINLRANDYPRMDDYMKTVTGKTAYYFAVPMIGGAIVAGADQKTIDRIIEFGSYAGPAFQIADDLLDLTAGKGRGEVGRDIKEGKRSILVVHCLNKCKIEEKARLIDILNKAPEKTSNEDVGFVKTLFERHGSIDYARNNAKELISKAKDSVRELPKELRDNLGNMADYLIERKK